MATGDPSKAPAPRRRRRTFAFWLTAGVFASATLALLLPASPYYLATLLTPKGMYEGRGLRHWLKQLDSADPQERGQAVVALGAIGEEAEEAVPALCDILQRDPDPEMRGKAAQALYRMGPACRSGVGALAAALTDPDFHVRMQAGMALLRLGPEARAAVPALTKALEDESNDTNLDSYHSTIREVAAVALGRATAGSDAGVAALAAALSPEGGEQLQAAAARGLGAVGAEARSAVPALIELRADRSRHVRESAERALEDILGADKLTALGKPGVAEKPPELPESERQYLWEIEHRGNLLVQHGLRPFAAAVRAADDKALARLLTAAFTGGDLDAARRTRVVTAVAEVERVRGAEGAAAPLSRDAFVARLLGLRKLYGNRRPEAQFSLKSLSPKRRGHLDGTWVTTVQLRLAGDHGPGGPAETVVVLRCELARLTREALKESGWLSAATIEQVTTAKADRYLFAEVARKRGLDPGKLNDHWKTGDFAAQPGGVYVADFNRDGALDALITDSTGTTLYQGRKGGTFEDVTGRKGLPTRAPRTSVVAWADLDGDGWEDLLLGGALYRNEKGERFADVTRQCNLRLPAESNNVAVADYDRDGKLDLYVTRSGRAGGNSWLDGKSIGLSGNQLWRNKGNWQFENVTRAGGASGDRRSTFTAAWLDADDDGWPDVHVINEFGDGVLLVNNRDGTFRRRALAGRPADFGSMGLAVGDVDNDGNIDIYCANMFSKAGTRVIGNLAPGAYPPATMEKLRRFVAGSQLHLNKGGLTFEQVGEKMGLASVGWAYGACLADLDNDGWLDVYATAGYFSKDRTEPDG